MVLLKKKLSTWKRCKLFESSNIRLSVTDLLVCSVKYNRLCSTNSVTKSLNRLASMKSVATTWTIRRVNAISVKWFSRASILGISNRYYLSAPSRRQEPDLRSIDRTAPLASAFHMTFTRRSYGSSDTGLPHMALAGRSGAGTHFVLNIICEREVNLANWNASPLRLVTTFRFILLLSKERKNLIQTLKFKKVNV